eukprot:TRINITY_DN95193_c0_g1_i1.p1 TRINITY_DN95193_c0_g1~~TRINITY_DN95193_c0_g1_i1.p1  ORF type:complete len:313 (+),score=33.52 TRINITY_DN95193_c0_g1_i1:75-1013(+)
MYKHFFISLLLILLSTCYLGSVGSSQAPRSSCNPLKFVTRFSADSLAKGFTTAVAYWRAATIDLFEHPPSEFAEKFTAEEVHEDARKGMPEVEPCLALVKAHSDPEILLPDGSRYFYEGTATVVQLHDNGAWERILFVGSCDWDGTNCQQASNLWVGEVYILESDGTWLYHDSRASHDFTYSPKTLTGLPTQAPSDAWLEPFHHQGQVLFVYRNSIARGPSLQQLLNLLTERTHDNHSDFHDYVLPHYWKYPETTVETKMEFIHWGVSILAAELKGHSVGGHGYKIFEGENEGELARLRAALVAAALEIPPP